MSFTKSELRSTLLQKRRSITPSQRALYDVAFARHATDLAVARHVSTVAAYIGLPGEPGGRQLVKQLEAICEVWLPISLADGTLSWSRFTGWENLSVGAYGILEPRGQRLRNPRCDFLFVPTLGITPTGVRLGKGGGYYDRFLSNRTAPCAALAYSWEVCEDIPQEEHDVSVNLIITESSIQEALSSEP